MDDNPWLWFIVLLSLIALADLVYLYRVRKWELKNSKFTWIFFAISNAVGIGFVVYFFVKSLLR